MGKNGGKTDYSRLTSRQIAVYKTDKALLELVDSLKPAGTAYPAHIHASGEEDEEGYSLIRLQMVGGLFGRDWAEVRQRICKHQPG